jgi:hypothetical protein
MTRGGAQPFVMKLAAGTARAVARVSAKSGPAVI